MSQRLLLAKSILVFWLIYTIRVKKGIGKRKVWIKKIRRIMIMIMISKIRIQILIQIIMRMADKLLRICK